jgi:hypothetical protein
MIGMRKLAISAVALLSMSLFAACGGGGGGGGAPAPTGTAVTTQGTIEKFGSIFVNGVEFRAKGATLFLPDDTATPQRALQTETQVVDDKLLKIGMVVTVKGTLDASGTTGSATEIEFRDALKAKIDNNGVDLVNNTITVMGQKVVLDDKIKPLLGSLKPGDLVQVSGLPDDSGHIHATFIEKKDLAQAAELEVKGFVGSVSGNTITLKLTSNATTSITVILPAGATIPAVGSFIEVRAATTATGGTITATTTHVEDIHVNPAPATPGVQVSIEGFPSSGTVADFFLNGQEVKTSAATVFVGGTAADFALTKKIQAEGLITNGILNATKIAFKTTVVTNPSISRGEIEKFGSLFVNGVEFKTTGAVLHLRDDKTTPDRVLQTETEIQGLLKQGMVVTVKGGLDNTGTTGTAREIEFRNVMEAQIDDKGVDFITVMGQKVIVDDKIKSALSTLVVGSKVAISALPDDKGGLRATFIEKRPDNLAEFEAKGFVSNLVGNTFTLLMAPNATSGLSVTLGAGVTLPAGAGNGSFVEVRTVTVGGVVIATSVEVENELKPDDNDKAELEGFVASGTVADFFVGGVEVKTSASTRFVGGIAADFAIGMKVEVEGAVVGGIINATKVEFKDNVRLDAIVTAFTPATASTQAVVTLLGKNAIITSATQLNLSGATIAAGQELQIRGFVASNGTDIIATRVDLRSLTPDAAIFRPFLRGPVTAKDAVAGTLTIAGVAITTSASTQFKDLNNVVLTAADFFNAITLNTTVVKVTWSAPFTSTSVAVREAELEK